MKLVGLITFTAGVLSQFPEMTSVGIALVLFGGVLSTKF